MGIVINAKVYDKLENRANVWCEESNEEFTFDRAWLGDILLKNYDKKQNVHEYIRNLPHLIKDFNWRVVIWEGFISKLMTGEEWDEYWRKQKKN